MILRRSLTMLAILASLSASAFAAGEMRGPSFVTTAADGSCRPVVLCPVPARSDLPNVLLIGDSISIGYTLPVRKLLDGKANVQRVPRNAWSTVQGLRFLDDWLGTARWDVIHVNFGIHDAHFNQKGAIAVPLDQYRNNLTQIVRRLKKTGAKVVLATSTPIPADAATATNKWADITQYNAVVLEVANRENVAVDDLFSAIKPREGTLQRPANVHFTQAGYEALAQTVAASVEGNLPRAK